MSFRLTWLGHNAFSLDIDGVKVLIDPFLSGNPTAAAKPDEVEADYILISHGHGDHVGDAVDIARRTGAMVVSNSEIRRWFAAQGIEKVHAQHIGGSHNFDFGNLKLTIAHHGSMLPDGSNGGNPAGLLITTRDGRRVYFACDTGLFYDMKLIGEEGLDLAVLPIGDNFTMGPDDALRAVKLLEPTAVIPVHYNTWDLIVQDAEAWARRVRQETGARPVVLKPGQSYRLD
jgi:L-ascorbate metabolism protein UlaG (beta-lactamase superfamily)